MMQCFDAAGASNPGELLFRAYKTFAFACCLLAPHPHTKHTRQG